VSNFVAPSPSPNNRLETKMDIHAVKVSKKEVDIALAKANPAIPAGHAEDACDAYRRVRPAIDITLPLLGVLYPPGAAALATIKVILDKACEVDK
jgi:hypothetical protein